jgi:hypothetical protein
MASTNSSTFPPINTANPDRIQILYRAPYASRFLTWLKCTGCPCTCCCFDNIKERIYFYVQENRIEYNLPGSCSVANCLALMTCKCKPADNVTVVYFDKNYLQNAAKAECCKPSFTHCSCFPNACNICGEAVVLYSDGKCGGCCCRSWIMLTGFEDAHTVADMINQARAMMSQRQVQMCSSGQVFGPQPVIMHAPSSTIIQAPIAELTGGAEAYNEPYGGHELHQKF